MPLETSPLVYPQSESAGLPIRLLSKCLSLLFSFAAFVRNFAFDRRWLHSHKLPGRVISVGNIAVGGTGKTPCIIAIAQYLQERGERVAILTRGYGSGMKRGEHVVLLRGKEIAREGRNLPLPDEARLESNEVPEATVIAGPDRWQAAQAYLQTVAEPQRPTVWLLEDGFQHRQLKRDLDIVLLDVGNPFGSGSLLPYGFLRESPKNLARADFVVLTGAGTLPDSARCFLQKFFKNNCIGTAGYKQDSIGKDIRSEKVFSEIDRDSLLLVTGIARPERLSSDLAQSGIYPNRKVHVGDHQLILSRDLSKQAQGMSAIITTAKDYWRNPDVFLEQKIPTFIKKQRFILPESLVEHL